MHVLYLEIGWDTTQPKLYRTALGSCTCSYEKNTSMLVMVVLHSIFLLHLGMSYVIVKQFLSPFRNATVSSFSFLEVLPLLLEHLLHLLELRYFLFLLLCFEFSLHFCSEDISIFIANQENWSWKYFAYGSCFADLVLHGLIIFSSHSRHVFS